MKALKSRLSKEQQDLQSKFAPLLQNKTCFSATFGRITPRITKHILKVSNILTPPPPTNGKCLVTHLKGSGVTHLGAFLYHRFPSPVFTGSDADKKAQKTKRLEITHKLVRKGRRSQFDGRQTIQLSTRKRFHQQVVSCSSGDTFEKPLDNPILHRKISDLQYGAFLFSKRFSVYIYEVLKVLWMLFVHNLTS